MAGETAQVKGLNKINEIGAIGAGLKSVRNLWGYVSNDTAAMIEGAGYFNAFCDLFAVGDLVLVSANVAGSPAPGLYVVSTITDGAVSVTAFAPASAPGS